MPKDSIPYLSSDHIPDIGEILHILRRHKKLIAWIMGVTMLLGGAIALIMPNSYRGSATVVLSDHNLNLNFKDVTAGSKFDEMTVQTEIKVLNSPSVALKTIKATGLDKTPEFRSSSGDEQEVVEHFLKNLNVDSQGTSRALEVSFKAHDPELAAKIANAHVQAYLESQMDFKKAQVEQLSHWFEERVRELKSDVVKKSQAVENYRTKENLTIGADDEELIYQQISDVAGQLVPVEVHKYDTQAKADAIDGVVSPDGAAIKDDAAKYGATEGAPKEVTLKNEAIKTGRTKPGQSGAMDDVVKSLLIQNLKTQASTLAQNLVSLSSKYGPNHPKVIEARSQLTQVNRDIAVETKKITDSIKNDHTATEAQEAMLKNRLETLDKQADNLREKTITLESLEVEADASKEVLDDFLKSYKNTQSQLTFARPDAMLVSPAVTPDQPAPPTKPMRLLIVFVFAVCLSLGVVFALEMMKSGIRNFDDIRKVGQKPLGIIPLVPDPSQAMLNVEHSSYKEAIKRIYMSGFMNSAARTLLVTSALPKEGRTTFVTSMGYYLMSLGHRVIVIDADFLRPSLSRLTSDPIGPGLSDVLTGRIPLQEAIDSSENGLAILRAGSLATASPDTLRSEKLHDLLEQLKQNYAYILIDSAPVLAHSEAGAMANEADGIIVITEWLKTSLQDVTNMLTTLTQFPTPVLGVVMNKVDIDKYKAISSGSDFLLPKAQILPHAAARA